MVANNGVTNRLDDEVKEASIADITPRGISQCLACHLCIISMLKQLGNNHLCSMKKTALGKPTMGQVNRILKALALLPLPRLHLPLHWTWLWQQEWQPGE
jgi:hypothetical protein